MHLWPVVWSTVSTAIMEGPQPSTLLTTSKLGVHGTPTFSSPISTATTPWWTTTPMKECCTLGTTSVWSLILSLLNHRSKKETAPAQNCTEVKRFSFNRAENRVQLKSGRTRRKILESNFLAKCFLENVFDLERKRHLVSELFRYIWIPRVKQSKRSRWTPFWERDLKAVPNERHCLLSCGFVCRARKLAVPSHEENEKRFHCKFGRAMSSFSQLFSLLAKQTASYAG